MLHIAKVKELLNDATISDDEIEQIRDDFRALAEVIFEQWQKERVEDKNVNKS